MTTKIFHRSSVTAAVLWLVASSAFAELDALEKSRKLVNSSNQQLQKSQLQINSLDDATQDMLDKYRTVVRESESYTAYNQQLRDVIQSQKKEQLSLQNQIEQLDTTSREVMPMMAEMIQALERFVADDMPFLLQERNTRIATLKSNQSRADLSIAEKYRKILEAYQIEIDYGKTLEAYQQAHEGHQVTFVKIGRTAFFYQSLDQKRIAVWNGKIRQWQTVTDGEIKRSVTQAIKIANKQQSPELLMVLAQPAEVQP